MLFPGRPQDFCYQPSVRFDDNDSTTGNAQHFCVAEHGPRKVMQAILDQDQIKCFVGKVNRFRVNDRRFKARIANLTDFQGILREVGNGH